MALNFKYEVLSMLKSLFNDSSTIVPSKMCISVIPYGSHTLRLYDKIKLLGITILPSEYGLNFFT